MTNDENTSWYHNGLFGTFHHWVSPPWLTDADRSAFDAGVWVRAAKDAHVDYLIFLSKWVDGLAFYPTEHGETKTSRDYLGELLEEVKRQGGIKAVVYYCVEVDHAVGRLHPEWRNVDQDGEPYTLGRFYKPSLCSPYGDIVRAQMCEVATRYGHLMDGFWIDDPYMVHSYDPYFTKQFEASSGKKREDAMTGELEAFCEEILFGMIQTARDTLKAVNPNAALTFNWSGKWPRLPQGAERAGMRRRVDLLDFVSYEGHDPMRLASFARLLRNSGKPFELTASGSVGGDWIGYVSKPACLLKLEAASVLVNGGSYCYGLLPVASGDLQDGDASVYRDVGAWIQERKPFFTNAIPVTEAAILISPPPSAKWWDTSPIANDFWPKLNPEGKSVQVPPIAKHTTVGNGFELALLSSHVQFDLLPSLESLRDHRLLILQDETCLSDSQCERIRQFVAEGGLLLAEGHASLLDEDGNKRADFALADVLGLSFGGYGPYLDGVYTRPLLDELRDGLIESPILIAGGAIYSIDVKADVLAPIIEPMGNRGEVMTWSEHNSPSLEDSKLPMVTHHRFGKGRAIYVAAPLGAYVSNRGAVDPWARILASNLVRFLLEDPFVMSDLATGIEIVLNRHPDRLVLHLINHYGSESTVLGNFPTLAGGRVLMNEKRLGRITHATIVPDETELPLSREGSYLEVGVPYIPSPSLTILLQ